MQDFHWCLKVQNHCLDQTDSPPIQMSFYFSPPAARTLPPVAHGSGSHTLTLPNNSLVLRGSITDGDQTEVHYLWVRDGQSPAAGVSTRKKNGTSLVYY